MPIQKTFKREVRARMAKTGESYTAARTQLKRKADARSAPRQPAATQAPPELLTSEAALRDGTGKSWDDWFALLDSWGATERRHPEIARWLREEQGVDGWWAQSITVGYERARGMRAKHQQPEGFAISATRTIAVPMERLRSAFIDPAVRRRWFRDGELRRRPTTALNTARFDWSDPPSRVVVTFIAKTDAKTTVAVGHERLPDAASAERMKGWWRGRLTDLKQLLEGMAPEGTPRSMSRVSRL